MLVFGGVKEVQLDIIGSICFFILTKEWTNSTFQDVSNSTISKELQLDHTWIIFKKCSSNERWQELDLYSRFLWFNKTGNQTVIFLLEYLEVIHCRILCSILTSCQLFWFFCLHLCEQQKHKNTADGSHLAAFDTKFLRQYLRHIPGGHITVNSWGQGVETPRLINHTLLWRTTKLVGGWTNPLWKICSSNWIISPRLKNKRCIWNHHPAWVQALSWLHRVCSGRIFFGPFEAWTIPYYTVDARNTAHH